MRKLRVNTFLTLDGVMQAPGGPEEDTSGGFKHGGWSVNYWDDRMGQMMGEFMGRPYDLVLGRKTYEIFAAHWPRVKDDRAADPGARQWEPDPDADETRPHRRVSAVRISAPPRQRQAPLCRRDDPRRT